LWSVLNIHNRNLSKVSNIDQRPGTRHARLASHRHHPVTTKVAAMSSVARVAHIPLKAFAVNVIAIYSRARRKRHKLDSITTVDPASSVSTA
jgi:hypothetical protein